MTWREIDAENLHKLRNPIIVDVRSPCEFAVERIPQAINIPLLTDKERARVGTVFAQQGEIAARRLGLQIIAPKIPAIVDQILDLRTKDGALVIHCWRGGLRSESVASFLTIVGIDCWRLKGGFKAWRRHMLDDFARDRYQFETVVLHGRTGTGKTEILSELAAQGAKIIDLENLSNHRGSFFGALGQPAQPTQKVFEALLWEQLRSAGSALVFVEAESRRVGRLSLPDFIIKRIETGHRVLVTGTVSARVNRLMQCYMPGENKTIIAEALDILDALTVRVGKQTVADLRDLARNGQFDRVVELLLELYYDPLYDKHIAKNEPFALTVDGDSACDAAVNILKWCEMQSRTQELAKS